MRELTDHIKGVAFWPGTSLGTVTIPPHERSQRMLALISCEWTFLQGAQEFGFQLFTQRFGQDGPCWSLQLSLVGRLEVSGDCEALYVSEAWQLSNQGDVVVMPTRWNYSLPATSAKS